MSNENVVEFGGPGFTPGDLCGGNEIRKLEQATARREPEPVRQPVLSVSDNHPVKADKAPQYTHDAPLSGRSLVRQLNARKRELAKIIRAGKAAQKELAQINRLIEAAKQKPAQARPIRAVG